MLVLSENNFHLRELLTNDNDLHWDDSVHGQTVNNTKDLIRNYILNNNYISNNSQLSTSRTGDSYYKSDATLMNSSYNYA